MKLKTLKDLRRLDSVSDVILIREKELRQEAIKWIKLYEKLCLPNNVCNYEGTEEFNKIAGAKILDGEYCHTWVSTLFKHFFNISEKDLRLIKESDLK